jgi:fatty-acyl-CoA synthase
MVIDLLGSPTSPVRPVQPGLHRRRRRGHAAGRGPAPARQYGLRYVEGYGLTETAAPSHNNPPDAPKQQCLGIPFMSTDARVVDPDTLQELPQGEQARSSSAAQRCSTATGNAQTPRAGFIERDGKRFFRSGDLGRVDEDGYFFMTDRLKRMINASGFKVWPAEVEALMFRHPAIQEACIISAKDDYRGETVKAVVVLRPATQGR